MKNSQRPDNQTSYSRRRFLGDTPATVAALAAVPMLTTATDVFGATSTNHHATGHPDYGMDYYDKLGVTKHINAAGTYTELTSAVMPPSVRAAVAEAALHPVHLDDFECSAKYLLPYSDSRLTKIRRV